MRRTLFPILVMLSLTACSNSGGGGYGGTQYSSDAHFLSDDPTVIEVTVRDPLPVKSAVLVDPTGVETAAYDIQRDKQVYRSDGGARPTVGVGVGGGSSGHFGTGIGIGFPIYSGGSDYRSDITESTAKVKISNPVLYRNSWQSWKLRVDLEDGGNKRTIELVPPKPL
ncbi:MAG TPA: hypothetical protein VJV39_16980 [Dongiaceae bacterium]|nr:hypothetical protein [Dongiaceae bacterium]